MRTFVLVALLSAVPLVAAQPADLSPVGLFAAYGETAATQLLLDTPSRPIQVGLRLGRGLEASVGIRTRDGDLVVLNRDTATQTQISYLRSVVVESSVSAARRVRSVDVRATATAAYSNRPARELTFSLSDLTAAGYGVPLATQDRGVRRVFTAASVSAGRPVPLGRSVRVAPALGVAGVVTAWNGGTARAPTAAVMPFVDVPVSFGLNRATRATVLGRLGFEARYTSATVRALTGRPGPTDPLSAIASLAVRVDF